MPSVQLSDRALILVAGPDAEHFLQNILTTDLDTLRPGEAKPGALLAPQGKILFDFMISRTGENGFRLECRTDVADDFVRRLMLYRLRAKAEISKQDQPFVAIEWQKDSAASPADSSASRGDSTASRDDSSSVLDTRFAAPARVTRVYGEKIDPSASDPAGWLAFRIANGIAESGADYTLGDAFPHDVLLDQMGGIGFKKGCYIGQEVVSRMQHRGTARRRVLVAAGTEDLPPAGTDILVNGRSVGTLGSTAGNAGLAVARIDRVKEAIDAGNSVMAGDVSLVLSIPAFATFTFPQDVAAEGA